jgi:hypothetical protein
MKLKAAFLAIALATASATSAGSVPLVSADPIPTSRLGPTPQETLQECQYNYLVACFRFTGDYVSCHWEASQYAC